MERGEAVIFVGEFWDLEIDFCKYCAVIFFFLTCLEMLNCHCGYMDLCLDVD